ncbi:MAG: hypothetical protein IKP28_06430 [Clostridia bacterium]|nr:hypothetical protein [Clostridia bacterium]
MRPRLYEDCCDMHFYEKLGQVMRGRGPYPDGMDTTSSEYKEYSLWWARGYATIHACSFFYTPPLAKTNPVAYFNSPEADMHSRWERVIASHPASIDQYIQEHGEEDSSPEEIIKLIEEAVEHCKDREDDSFEPHNKRNDGSDSQAKKNDDPEMAD